MGVESGQSIRSVNAPQRPVAPAGSGTPLIELTFDQLRINYVERATQLRTPEHERFTNNPLPTQTGSTPNIPVNLQPLVLPQHQAANIAQAAPAETPSAPITQLAPALEALEGLMPELRPLIAQARQESRVLRAGR